jgi:hypothetical protein
MKTIKTLIDDDAYAELARKRRAEGLPSVSALFLKKCGVLTDDDEAREIVRTALRKAKAKRSGYEFRLRELFPDSQWEKFGKGARLRAGRLFYARIAEATHGIRTLPKTSSNHQRYQTA